MAHVTVVCFLASYLVAFLLELSRLLGRSRISRFVMVGFSVAGFAAHNWYLLNRAHQTHLPPLLASTHDWMLVLAWVLVLFYLFITLLLALSRQDLAVGVFALPVVLILVFSTYFLSQEPNTALTEAAAKARWSWGIFHAALLVFGMTAGAVGLVSGSMYLIQHHRLKTRLAEHTGFRMPSLARLAQVNRWSIILTYFLLTLGFASGVYLGISAPGGASPVGIGDPAVIVSSLVWLLFGALFIRLWGQRSPGGRQVAWLTIGGCGFLLVTLLGLQVLTGSIHAAGSAGSHPLNAAASLEGRP
jgi:hypothetical protein